MVESRTLPQRRSWLAEASIIAVLVLLPLLFWWRLWATDPADRAAIPYGDFTEQYYPLQLFGAREMAEGRLPAWDPYINAGQPGLPDIQTGFFYPPNLLANLLLISLGLPFSLQVLTVQVILHFSMASLFTYLLVRHLARRAGARLTAARFAGAVSALAFTYGGYLTSFPVQQLTILQTAVWLPLVLFFLDRAFYHSNPLPQVVLAGMTLACALLAGHPQTAMYVMYATLAYGLFLAWSTRGAAWKAWPGNRGILVAASVLLPFILGIGLAAVQLVPTLEFIVRSTRADLNYSTVAWGFPLAEMTHLLYPGYFGGSPQYVGILPPILAVAALFVIQARREVIFWLVFGLVALLLAFGGNTFLYSVAYLLMPGFGSVRNQERIIYLFSFAVSILAGYGALTLVQPLPRPMRKGFCSFGRGLAWVWVAFLALTALFYFGHLQSLQQEVGINLFEGLLRHHVLLLLILGGSALLLALRQTGRVRRNGLMALALGLVWLNLFTINWRMNLEEPVAGGPYPETGLVAFLQGQPGTFRISSAGLLPGGASAGIVYELEDITGNTPLRLASFQQFEDQVGSWRRWQLLNVQYILTVESPDGPGLEQVYEEGGVQVYRVGDPLPRAWVVHDTLTAGDDRTLDLLNATDFDPRMVAIVPPGDGSADLSLDGGPGVSARVVESASGKLILEASPAKDGLLVVSQPFYPGWQARVDGQEVPIYRVDYLLQGVPLKAGGRRVEMTYHLSRLPGLISVAVLLGCVVTLILGQRRRSRNVQPQGD